MYASDVNFTVCLRYNPRFLKVPCLKLFNLFSLYGASYVKNGFLDWYLTLKVLSSEMDQAEIRLIR